VNDVMDKDQEKTELIFAWSGGKDSAMGLYEILRDERYRVASLLTTVTADYDRISMHGVRRELLHEQAQELGLPLVEVAIGKGADNAEYEAKMGEELARWKARGVETVAFADIFLEDLRRYREENLAKGGMKAVFPIWKVPTTELAHRFIALGFRAILACVDTQKLDASFSGRDYDDSLLRDLPASVDPCGENGEFHSFVHAGPIFAHPIPVTRGEVVLREGRFAFCDLLAAPTG
jgi:uncharacterized protein (TIGR00290 family)